MEVSMTTIRAARTYDAAAIAGLCGELGYPATRAQIVSRLAVIEADAQACVLVAEDASGVAAGCLHLALCASLADEPCVEIRGLVVAASARGRGIGGELLLAADAWAHARGCARVCVRSRVERERAHRFYERAGFIRAKTQAVFGRAIRDDTRDNCSTAMTP
jgi:N-acetylglutamate synthase-like GNAT family acetyltransferase